MNQRQRPRTPLPNGLSGEVTVYRPLQVSDLSPRGARVETPEPLRVNSIRAFRFNLGDQTVVLKGRVCHSSVRTLDDDLVVYTSGVEFLDVPTVARQAIERFLDRAVMSPFAAEHGEIH
ncbi:MAG: PilZ domain-containing protein [Acidobacteria bacterium]|nr:PilZ domain-containing protein [Acidobacteriota bacterium]